MEAVWRQRRAGMREGAVKGGCQGWRRQQHVHTTGQRQRAVVVARDGAGDPSTWLLFHATPGPTVRTYLVLCPYRADSHTSTGLSQSQEAGSKVGLKHGCDVSRSLPRGSRSLQ